MRVFLDELLRLIIDGCDWAALDVDNTEEIDPVGEQLRSDDSTDGDELAADSELER